MLASPELRWPAAAPHEVAITDRTLAPIAYGRLTPKKSVSSGTNKIPPPRPRMAPSTPAAVAVPRIIERNVMSLTTHEHPSSSRPWCPPVAGGDSTQCAAREED